MNKNRRKEKGKLSLFVYLCVTVCVYRVYTAVSRYTPEAKASLFSYFLLDLSLSCMLLVCLPTNSRHIILPVVAD